jgi:hypothetical protein
MTALDRYHGRILCRRDYAQWLRALPEADRRRVCGHLINDRHGDLRVKVVVCRPLRTTG